MNFLEKDLEQIIYETCVDKLYEKGLSISKNRKRQVRIGNYGIADIVTIERPPYITDDIKVYYDEDCTHDGEIMINVYELKKDKISVSAFIQALNYVKGIKTYLQHRKFRPKVRFTITLIGSELDTSGAFCYFPEILSSDDVKIEFYTYSYGVDGIEFNEENGYNLTNTGF